MFPSELTYFLVACALSPVKQNLSATCIIPTCILLTLVLFIADFLARAVGGAGGRRYTPFQT